MTREDALRLAQAKWGGDATVSEMLTPPREFTVGYISGGKINDAGIGVTWEEACRRAGLLTTNDSENEK